MRPEAAWARAGNAPPACQELAGLPPPPAPASPPEVEVPGGRARWAGSQPRPPPRAGSAHLRWPSPAGPGPCTLPRPTLSTVYAQVHVMTVSRKLPPIGAGPCRVSTGRSWRLFPLRLGQVHGAKGLLRPAATRCNKSGTFRGSGRRQYVAKWRGILRSHACAPFPHNKDDASGCPCFALRRRTRDVKSILGFT